MSDAEIWTMVIVFIVILVVVLGAAMLAQRALVSGAQSLRQQGPLDQSDWRSPALERLNSMPEFSKHTQSILSIAVALFIFVPAFRALLFMGLLLLIPLSPMLLGGGGLLLLLRKAGLVTEVGTALGGPTPVLKPLLDDDPNFSLPVFREFAVLLYSQALLERPANFPHSRPYLSEAASRTLSSRSRAQSITDVVVGTCLLESARAQNGCIHLRVRFESNYIEMLAGGEQAIVANESWTFTRQLGSLTRIPEGPSKLACPGCGFAGDFPSTGQCPQCGRNNHQAQLDWLVSNITVIGLENFRPHQAEGGGVEAGTNLATVVHPQLPVRKRELEARHPDFSLTEFEGKVREIFMAINQAWNDRDWARARPYETDALFRTHRYWIDDYLRKGQINRLDQIQLTRVVLSNIVLDAFYESITVRLFASMTDCTIDANTGQVLFGDAKRPRAFTEYWTFIRRVGHKSAKSSGCPSCGAPLDRVNQAGVCEYCDSLITKGDFGWVLSNIEQDEVYRLSF